MSESNLTITIATYDRPALLRESIRSAVYQNTTRAYKIIVVSNSQSCENREIVNEFKREITYVENETNLGMIGNWNRCIQLCDTDWISILHDDDLLSPDFVEEMTAGLDSRVGLYSCGVQIDASPPSRWPERTHAPLRRVQLSDFVGSNISPYPGVVANRRSILSIGGFDEQQKSTADYRLWFTLAARYGAYHNPKTLAYYRTGTAQSSFTMVHKLVKNSHKVRLMAAKKAGLPRWFGVLYARLSTVRQFNNYQRHYDGRGTFLTRIKRALVEVVAARLLNVARALELGSSQK